MKAIFALLFVCVLSASAAHLRTPVADNELNLNLGSLFNPLEGLSVLTSIVPNAQKLLGSLAVWKNVSWSTGAGVQDAFQSTVQGIAGIYNAANTLTHGLLAPHVGPFGVDINKTLGLASNIVVQGGKFLYQQKNNSFVDVTNEFTIIKNAVKSGNFFAVSQEALKIFNLFKGGLGPVLGDFAGAGNLLTVNGPIGGLVANLLKGVLGGGSNPLTGLLGALTGGLGGGLGGLLGGSTATPASPSF